MRALDIIDLFVDRSPELSAAEIAEATDLPRTRFMSCSALWCTGATWSGMPLASIRWGVGAADRQRLFGPLQHAGRRHRGGLRETAVTHGVTCSVAVLEVTDVFYLAKVEGREILPASSVGKTPPAHATALGKMLLSSLGSQLKQRLYPSGQLPALMPNTITDLDVLKAELAEVRRRVRPGIRGVNTQRCLLRGRARLQRRPCHVAAVSVTLTTTRWASEPEAHCGHREDQCSVGGGGLGHQYPGAGQGRGGPLPS